MKIYDDKHIIQWVYAAQNFSKHVPWNKNLCNLQSWGEIQMTGYKYHNLNHFSYLYSTNANYLEIGYEGAWEQTILTSDPSSKFALSRRSEHIKRKEDGNKTRKF